MAFLIPALALIVLGFLIAAIIGLFKPSVVKQPTRQRAFTVNLISAFAAFLLMCVLAVLFPKEKPNSVEAEPTVESKPQPTNSEAPIGAGLPAIIDQPTATANTEPPKRPKNQRAPEHIELVANSLISNYEIQPTVLVGDKYCLRDNFCEIRADSIQIQAMGITVTALPSSQVSPRYYQTVCSAILMGLGQVNQDLAEETIVQAFNKAGQDGQAKFSLNNVEMEISPRLGSLLQCRFVKIP